MSFICMNTHLRNFQKNFRSITKTKFKSFTLENAKQFSLLIFFKMYNIEHSCSMKESEPIWVHGK